MRGFTYFYTHAWTFDGHSAHLSMAKIESGALGNALVGLMETNSRKLIRMLERDGWVLDRVSGDHHTFKHPEKDQIITMTHPRRDLPIGLVRRLYKLAGWRP